MKRFAAWAAWMAAAALAHGAQARPAYVNFGYLGVSDVPVYRLDDSCYVALDIPESWGWRVSPATDGKFQISVGDRTLELSTRRIDGVTTFDLTDLARQLDADARWRPHTDVLDFSSRIRVIRVLNGHLSVCASLPVQPRVTFTPQSDKVFLDLLGASLSQDAIVDVLPGLDVSSPKPGDIRITLPIRGPFAVDPKLGDPASEIDLDTTLGIPAPGQPIEETLTLDRETDSTIDLSLPLPATPSRPPQFKRLDATTLQITLPGINVLLSPEGATTRSIEHVQAKVTPSGTELVFHLIRPMGVTLSTDAGLHIRFVKPPVGDGRLAGKVIVVDAGHGGKDSGTKALSDGLTEKSLTLPISKYLAADLAAQGATVIMTRQTDVFIPLEERAAIANRNHANLFLCVHINSNGHDRTSSGTITFFHNQDPVSSTLADCIQREIVGVSGIPGIGTWSDTRIYRVGFSVLRNARMPAVLMELGFMDNKHDRQQLVRQDIQQAIAAGIVKGVQVYLGQKSDHEK